MEPEKIELSITQPNEKFLLLDYRISGGFKDRLLGCVVDDVSDLTSGGPLPNFERPEDAGSPDYETLKTRMKGFSNPDADPQHRIVHEYRENLSGLSTKFLTGYGPKENRSIEIEAATGKSYHLYNSIFEFKDRLWSNKYYRDCIYDMIHNKLQSGTLETLNKCYRKYGVNKSPSHKCDVVILPMIVGILTRDEVKFDIVDSYGRTTETNSDDNIIAIAYDLIAIPTGNLDPEYRALIHQSQSRHFFREHFSFGSNTTPKPCPECEFEKSKPGPSSAYADAWWHGSIRGNVKLPWTPHVTTV